MRNTNYLCLFVILCTFISSGCAKRKTIPESERVGNEQVQELPQSEPDQVKVVTLRKKSFNKELLSNGRLEAVNKAEMRFQAQEIIVDIAVRNGDVVSQGQKIASLNPFKSEQQLIQSKEQLQLCRINLEDLLIGQGFSLVDSTLIPKELLQIARIKSGYERAMADVRNAEYNFRNLTLYAPFNGVIANLTDKTHNLPSPTDPFCCVIGNQEFDAQFKILENELPSVKKGDRVVVTPLAVNEAFEGVISTINPTIDEKGLLKVSARIRNRSGKLYDGMNVNVVIRERITSCLVVPKTAVVIRGGRTVVFVHQQGRAKWKYVTILMENSSEYALADNEESVRVGDEIIYEGAINLAHDAPVNCIY